MKITNPLTQTSEWKALVSKYIRMMKKYQDGPNWCFDHIQSGIEWNDKTGRFDKLMTIETLKDMVKRVSPIGPEVSVEDVKIVSLMIRVVISMIIINIWNGLIPKPMPFTMPEVRRISSNGRHLKLQVNWDTGR